MNSYIEGRRRVFEARIATLLDTAKQEPRSQWVRAADSTKTAEQELVEYTEASTSLSQRQKATLKRLVSDLNALSTAHRLVNPAAKEATPYLAGLAIALNAHPIQTPRKGAPPTEHPPDTPGRGSSAGSGGPRAGGGDGGAGKFFEQAANTSDDIRIRHPQYRSGLEAPRHLRFRTAARGASVRFGGVVIGNDVDGPAAVTLMEYVRVRDTSSIDEQEDVGLSYVVRVYFADGHASDYAGFSNQDLWSAVNFVQPTQQLQERLRRNGIRERLAGNSIGVVGIDRRSRFDTLFPGNAGWYFGINPAFAHTSLAFDAMRLDMLISVAANPTITRLSPNSVPPSLRQIDWGRTRFGTYQWYDMPAQLRDLDGLIFVGPKSDPDGCLMQIRLLDYSRPVAYPPWYDDQSREKSIETEANRRTNGDVSSLDTERAKVWSEIDDVETKAFESSQLRPVARSLCNEFDALGHIDRFARLVAILNWYVEKSGNPLPPLPSDDLWSDNASQPFLMYRSVLPSAVPAVNWSAIAIWAGWFWLRCQILLGLMVLLWFAAVALRWAQRKLFSRRQPQH